MRVTTRWMAVLAVLAGFGAISTLRAEDAKIEGDLKKMQGTWVKAGSDGPDAKWVIEGDKLTATVNGQDYICKITLDPKATPHPSADLAIKDGPAEAAGMTSKAIYKFDGEKLVFCVASPGVEARPSEFKGAEAASYLFEFKKEK